MCEPQNRQWVPVHVDARVAAEQRPIYKFMPIDTCIARMVETLDQAGYRMLASCCGHGKNEGEIVFADGRTITIAEARKLATDALGGE